MILDVCSSIARLLRYRPSEAGIVRHHDSARPGPHGRQHPRPGPRPVCDRYMKGPSEFDGRPCSARSLYCPAGASSLTRRCGLTFGHAKPEDLPSKGRHGTLRLGHVNAFSSAGAVQVVRITGRYEAHLAAPPGRPTDRAARSTAGDRRVMQGPVQPFRRDNAGCPETGHRQTRRAGRRRPG
jgi:hypothetical protein